MTAIEIITQIKELQKELESLRSEYTGADDETINLRKVMNRSKEELLKKAKDIERRERIVELQKTIDELFSKL